MRTLICLLFGIALALLQGFSITRAIGSDIKPPEPPDDLDSSLWTFPYQPVKKVTFGILPVQLERTTLREIKDRVGVGVIHERGDAGDYESYLCYSGRTAERIWVSAGEMGGSEHAVTSVLLSTAIGSERPADCPQLPDRFQPILVNRSLSIGSSVGQLEKLFGSPSTQKDGWLLYPYIGKVMSNKYDRVSLLAVRVNNGKIANLAVFQTTSN
ncbi:MAG: hypothetical protein LBH14_08465 [Desulfobulbaceae bacterium]|nr:hypothetical protein [Desulfobulbaceae bacterium]